MKKEVDIVLRREVKAVLFDLDGVLIDSFDAWYRTFNDSLKYFGLRKLSKKEFKKDFGAPIEHDIKKYFKGKTVKKVVSLYNINFDKRKKYVRLFPNSKIIIKKLKKQIKLGLISNSTKSIVLTILNHYKLTKYFDVIVTMDDVKRRKPAPDMVLKACRKLKVKPKNTILVGDTKNDMSAGKKAGCITIGYKVKEDYKIERLSDVTKFI